MAIKPYDRPNGNVPFGIILLTTAAFVLSRYAANTCEYLYRAAGSGSSLSVLQPSTVVVLNSSVILGIPRSFGIWSFKGTTYNGSTACYINNSWPSGFGIDTKWNSARAFTVLTAVLGGSIMITVWFSPCVPYSSRAWKLIGLILLITTLFEGLTLIMFRSYLCQDPYTTTFGTLVPDCTMSNGAKCNVSATVFWFVAAVLCMAIPEPKRERTMIKETVVTTETVQPDGTKVVEQDMTTEPA